MTQLPDDAAAMTILVGALSRRGKVPPSRIDAIARKIIAEWRQTERQFIEFADKAIPAEEDYMAQGGM